MNWLLEKIEYLMAYANSLAETINYVHTVAKNAADTATTISDTVNNDVVFKTGIITQTVSLSTNFTKDPTLATTFNFANDVGLTYEKIIDPLTLGGAVNPYDLCNVQSVYNIVNQKIGLFTGSAINFIILRDQNNVDVLYKLEVRNGSLSELSLYQG